MPFFIQRKKYPNEPGSKQQEFIKSVEPEVVWTDDRDSMRKWDNKVEARAARDVYKLDNAHVLPC